MGKRVVVIGLIVTSLVAMLGTRAEAHWIYVAGKLLWTTLDCQWDLKGVPNTSQVASVAECVTTGFVVDVRCTNSQGHQTKNPGVSALQTVIVGEHQINPGDFTGRGKATVSVPVDTDGVFLNPDTPGLCVNDGWIPVQYLIREVTANYNVFDCTTADCSSKLLASTAELQCTIPSQYTLDNPPPDGTPFDCSEVLKLHLR